LLRDDPGYKYGISVSRIKGVIHWGLSHTMMNDTWNANDLGLTLTNNEVNNSASINHTIYDPFWIIRDVKNAVSISRATNYLTNKPTDFTCNYSAHGTFMNYLTFWYSITQALQKNYDYYEPRIAGRYYISPLYTSTNIGCSSDYRKPFAYDAEIYYNWWRETASNFHSFYISPRIRVSNQLMLIPSFYYSGSINNIGYISIDTSNAIIFGKRDISTFISGIYGQYIFKNDLSFSINIRHYWSKAQYDKFFTLEQTGYLTENNSFNENHNFNFNSFNIDMVFSWQFSPGSTLSIVWKNAILQEDNKIINNFYHDLHNTFDSPQTNSLSLKVLYYLDYNYLKRKSKP